MAVTHVTSVRNSLADLVVDLLNSGTLEIQTSTGGEVATLGLASTAFGASTAGVATANTISDDTSATGGTAAQAVFKTSTGGDRVTCSVSGSGGGGDIELSNTTIPAATEVSISSLTYTAPN